ncbi:MAG: hypothetical protein IKN16_12280 [Selenomonadaceae bacterium]|nr:hypothetical protein [Selenomonadaceae bacterium]MBR6889199.1 hypothetical protein [Selenomonadaceae bacterium]
MKFYGQFNRSSARTIQQPSSIVAWRRAGRPRRRELVEGDNLAAFLYSAVDYADWLFRRQPAQFARQGLGGGLAIRFVLVCAASAYALLIGNLYRNETMQNISVSVRTFGNPTQSYLEFYIYGFMFFLSALYFRTKIGLRQAMVFYTLPAFLACRGERGHSLARGNILGRRHVDVDDILRPVQIQARRAAQKIFAPTLTVTEL